MKTRIDINDPICPSCGYPKVDSTNRDMTGKPLCWYCYHRGKAGSVRLFILYLLDNVEKINSFDLLKMMNESDMNDHKVIFEEHAFYDITARMKKNKLILRRKISNPKGMGNKINEFKISAEGRRRLNKYLDLWDHGLFMDIAKNKTFKRIRMRGDNKFKYIAIKKKIFTEEYGRFDFLFSDALKNPKFHMVDVRQ